MSKKFRITFKWFGVWICIEYKNNRACTHSIITCYFCPLFVFFYKVYRILGAYLSRNFHFNFNNITVFFFFFCFVLTKQYTVVFRLFGYGRARVPSNARQHIVISTEPLEFGSVRGGLCSSHTICTGVRTALF